MYASPNAPVQNKIISRKWKDLRDPGQLTIYGIEKLKHNQAVPAESQKLRTNTLIKENVPNPQGTALAQSRKLISPQENEEELPSQSIRWTAEKLPSTTAPTPTPALAPAIEPIDLSAISPSKLARLALLDSMNF